jgi:beta-lactamase class A
MGKSASGAFAARDDDPFGPIEAEIGGRLGAFALDTRSGAVLAHRGDERFALCSTFKWALAAAVLKRVDGAELGLDQPVSYGSSDLLEYAPTTRQHVAAGALSVEELAMAVVVNSDNTAANLLLAKIGGPPAMTDFFRSLGDPLTRLDRPEPDLNANVEGDLRDTTSPRVMVGAMRAVLCGDVLSRAQRSRLLGWMNACETGHDRLRAGLPREWRVGDKTGTGVRGAVNDIAIAFPPGRPPILIACYLSGSPAPLRALNAAHALVARRVAEHIA